MDGYENLLLLCLPHHEIVDTQVNTYPVEKLLQFRSDHEAWVRSSLSGEEEDQDLLPARETVPETVYSTLMPVTQIPTYVYSAPCDLGRPDVQMLIQLPTDGTMAPFILKGGRLFAFNDLTADASPFRKAVDPYTATREQIADLLSDPNLTDSVIELFNRTLNKVTGRLGLQLDRDHDRFYFEPEERGKPLRVSYTSVGGKQSTRSVAWNPVFKHNNQPKDHWIHLAVGLRFHRLSSRAWALAIRPERRYTRDGFVQLPPDVIGRKSTRLKARMYNFDLLQEVQFWRDFLARGQPRISCRFGKQALVLDNALLAGNLELPKIEGDEANRMSATYEEDLFSLLERNELDALDEIEIDDLGDEGSDED